MVPALAVADALAERGAEVSFVGTRDRAEADLVPAAGYEIDFLDVSGIDRRNPLRAARAVGKSLAAVRVARRYLADRGAEAVMGGGGYVAAPAGMAAIRTGLPLVLTEADSHLGLTNRLLARRARRVCLAFPIEGREDDRYLVTGRPVPAAIVKADRGAARERFGIAPDVPCLLIFGGSLGALRINRAAAEAFGPRGPAAERPFHVLHIAGARDYPVVAPGLEGASRYTLLEYLPDLGDALAASDLVLCRSGGSVFELTAAGRPAVLVPYPYASGQHQHANARWMADAGAATIVEDSDLDAERLRAEVEPLLADPARIESMSAAARLLARPDAADRVAAEILATASTGDGR
ncbi:MAG: UDP-N-acetylglucosamine--N-acetylmuramyl-(pentapeptide) pyrophosphoryl-undecaprenol N-acetylglucosamine transferase [Solirubrobacterales bacterium]